MMDITTPGIPNILELFPRIVEECTEIDTGRDFAIPFCHMTTSCGTRIQMIDSELCGISRERFSYGIFGGLP